MINNDKSKNLPNIQTQRDEAARTRPTDINLGQELREKAHKEIEELYNTGDIAYRYHIDSLQVEKILGEGGMGKVIQVFDPKTARKAALKILLPDQSGNNTTLKRFLREQKITAKLEHPAIPPIYEVGKNRDGKNYILMHLVKGKELTDRIKEVHEKGLDFQRDKAELNELLKILVQVAEAVAFAHSKGIIHRDLKPANIMLGEHSQTMLMDWGIAKDLSKEGEDQEKDETIVRTAATQFKPEEIQEAQDQGLTLDGAVLGTLGYMSPEQALGDEVGKQTDVFALGAILSEILTGLPPIDLEDKSLVEVISAMAKGQIIAPIERNPQVPKELNAIAVKALSSVPKDRSKSAKEFAEELKTYIRGEDLDFYPYSFLEKTSRKLQRETKKAVVTSGSFILLLMALASLNAYQGKKLAESSQSQIEKISENRAKVKRLFFEAEQALKLGKEDLLKSKIKDAIKIIRTQKTLTQGAKLLTKQGNLKDAEKLLIEAIKLQPPAYETLYELHLVELMKMQQVKYTATPAIEKILATAKKRKEENEFTYFIKASDLYDKKNYKETIKFCNKALEKNLNFAPVYNLRAFAHVGLKQFTQALADYSKSIELEPDLSEAYYSRSYIYFSNKKDTEKALEDCNKAIEISPKFGKAYMLRASIRLRKKELSLALSDSNKSIELAPDLYETYYIRALVSLSLRKTKQALSDLNEAIRIRPEFTEAYFNRAKLLGAKGDNKAALKDYKKAIELNANFVDAYKGRGDIYQAQGSLDRALVNYNKAINLEQGYAQLYYQRGNLYLKQKKNTEALKDFELFLELAANSPKAAEIRRKIQTIKENR